MTFRDWKEIFELLAFVAQVVSFPIAALSLFMSRVEARASRDLHVALTLSESFRKYWESGWGDNLESIVEFQRTHPGAPLSSTQEKILRFMLNWIDWLGTFIKTKCFSNPELVLGSISGRIAQITNAGRGIIESDIKHHGVGHWKGVLTVSQLLKVDWTDAYVSGLQ